MHRYANTWYIDFIINIQGDSKLLTVFPWPVIFQTGRNKIKLLTEYESITQKVLLPIESVLGARGSVVG
jgi:hypothetical protein